MFRRLKTNLTREDFLDWDPDLASCTVRAAKERHTSTAFRDGPLGRRKREERLCKICVTGEVESEAHFLLECYVYNKLRRGMFAKIRYDLLTMDSKDWLMDVLLGHGLKSKEVRQKVGKAVAAFIAVAMRLRKKECQQMVQARA